MKTSGFLNLNWKDLGKGLALAVIIAAVNFIKPFFEPGNYHLDWKLFLNTEWIAISAYLAKNLFTNSGGEILSSDKK